jgi:hypothetical protein
MQKKGEGVQYLIKDVEVTAEEYEKYVNGIESRARPVWLKYSRDNIAAVVSKF